MDFYINNFKKKKFKNSNKLKLFISKFLLALIFLLCSIIYTNMGQNYKDNYKKYVLSESICFTKFRSMYEKMFGRVLPKKETTGLVFDGKLTYKKINKYMDGEELTLNTGSIINTITSGVVVYIGNKENYNNTVIIQGIDGVDIWYGNLDNVSVKLYDYIEKNTIIGNILDDKLYLVIKKDNNYLTYEDYKNK